MTQAIAKLIRDVVLESPENFEVHFHNDYSGRGMYGRQCVGISGTEQECQRAIAACISEAHYSGDEDLPEFADLVAELLNSSRDSLGLGIIVYWPNIEPASDDDEPEFDGQPDEAQEWHDFDPEC